MKSSLAAVIALAVFVAGILIVPLPPSGRVIRSMSDLLHAPLFALLTTSILGFAQNRSSLSALPATLICCALVVSLGVVTELIQSCVGRYASWQDVGANICGVCAGVLWTRATMMPARGWRAGVVVASCLALLLAAAKPLLTLTDAVLQRLEMPVLASFERPTELSRWNVKECRVNRSLKHTTHGSRALRVELEPGTYPGVILAYPTPDWSRYQELLIDVHLTSGPPLDLIVKINDSQHNGDHHDRFHQTVRLLPGKNQILVALTEVARAPRGREMDLGSIAALSLFTIAPKAPRTLYLDHLRLQ